MNKKLAIDIVLLPSGEMMEHVIAVNKVLRKNNPPKIILNKRDCLPHISLLMGCVEEKDLPQINQLIQELCTSYPFPELRIEKAQVDTMSNGQKVTVLAIEKTGALQALHEMVIEKLKPCLSYDAMPDMLYNPSEVEEITLDVINNFLQKSSYENFSPHITAGVGSYTGGHYPVSFTASAIAVCQLGNYCTCRKVLYAVEREA